MSFLNGSLINTTNSNPASVADLDNLYEDIRKYESYVLNITATLIEEVKDQFVNLTNTVASIKGQVDQLVVNTDEGQLKVILEDSLEKAAEDLVPKNEGGKTLAPSSSPLKLISFQASSSVRA